MTRLADVEALEEAGDARALASVGRGGRVEEALAKVAVAEAVQDVFPAQDDLKKLEIGGDGGIERPLGAPVGIADGLGEPFERAVRRRGVVDDRQGIEVPLVGRQGDGGVAREVGDPPSGGPTSRGPAGRAAHRGGAP